MKVVYTRSRKLLTILQKTRSDEFYIGKERLVFVGTSPAGLRQMGLDLDLGKAVLQT